MEFLQNLFGNLSSGVIRLAVTVGILAAVYFFIVKPVLNTTDHAFDNVNESLRESGIDEVSKEIDVTSHRVQNEIQHAVNQSSVDTKGIEENVNKTIEEVNKQVQTQVEHSFHVAKIHGGEAKTEKLLHCIQRAHQNVHRIERCSRRYS